MDNLNISFAPDKSAEDKGRINAVEDYLSLLTERIKFCLNGIDENVAQKSDGEVEKQLIYSTIADEVGQFTDTARNCEVFNDYENNVASAYYSHAEGYMTTANAPYSHAEGSGTTASAPSCHAEGNGTTANMEYAHAEGNDTGAYGLASHTEGEETHTRGRASHAEGYRTYAEGLYSHAEGEKCTTYGQASHAGGRDSKANLQYTFAHGIGVESSYAGGAAFGQWNATDNALFVVGCGYDDEDRRDALVLDHDGNLYIRGYLSASNIDFSVPIATQTVLGGVKIGENITIATDGTISVDLSGYLLSAEISDWAKADSKPTYTASEIGLGNVDNTADADKPISTATQTALDGKADTAHTHKYDASESIAGQTIDLDDLRLNEDTDKGTVHRYNCSVSAAQNITNRPTAVNEPFSLEVRNIKSAATSYVTQQKYISPSRRKEYVRWCADGVWSAWQATDNRTIYGTIAPGTERSYAYTTYGEGYGKIKLTAMYGADEGSNMVNIKAATLVSDSAFERNMLTVGTSVFKINITDGNVTLSVVEGTASFSYELMYFN